jgi:hypothetical protein
MGKETDSRKSDAFKEGDIAKKEKKEKTKKEKKIQAEKGNWFPIYMITRAE